MSARAPRSGPATSAARALGPILATMFLACGGDGAGRSLPPDDSAPASAAGESPRGPARPAVTLDSPPADPARGDGAPAASATEAVPIAARLSEYSIRLSISELRENRVAFSFRNEGERVHTIEIRGDNAMRWRTLPIRPGVTVTLTMDLPPGRYIVRSTEPPYVDRGMSAQLLVR